MFNIGTFIPQLLHNGQRQNNDNNRTLHVSSTHFVLNLSLNFNVRGPGVAWWLRHCATSRTVLGSIPGGVTGDFFRGSP